MFDIRLLPATQLGPDGQRLGVISVGDFTEYFACHRHAVPVDEFEGLWRHELSKLIGGEPAVALVHDPHFAWVVYRVGQRCFVQQILSPTGSFSNLGPRNTHTEEGDRISEWTIDLAEIRSLLAA